MSQTYGPAGKIADYFINSKLTPLIIIASILLGLAAVVALPREEEPQIIVPMIDIFVQMPGSDAAEVEQRVTRPMEKLLWEIPGVEYIYSTSMPGMAMTVVRFLVGQNEEESIVRLQSKLMANMDRIPCCITPPLIKPRYIDDVPILALTFWSDAVEPYLLRRVAAEVEDQAKREPNVSITSLIGGESRRVEVQLDPARMAGYGLDPVAVSQLVFAANQAADAGSYPSTQGQIIVHTGGFLKTAEDVRNVVVSAYQGRPVYLGDVATVVDGPPLPENYVFFGAGPAAGEKGITPEDTAKAPYPAVTLTLSKRKGTNAISVAEKVLERVERLKGTVIPDNVHMTITRHYGETAKEKSDELLWHMLIAVVSVTVLIWFTLGHRESGVVAFAIPVTLALTMAVFYLYGYTLNRITLFALIFSIGILVDDAIVVVENIVRHLRLPGNKDRPRLTVAVEAVDEVGNPTILATLTVIAAILPMAFVGGLMGPYMRPIPVGASAAMVFSLIVAFIVTPWASLRLLKSSGSGHGHGGGHDTEDWATRLYRSVMDHLLHNPLWRWSFLIGVAVLLLGAMAMVGVGLVKVKMLPFDNKNEFQIVVDMPEGTTLETTDAVVRQFEHYLRGVPEVTNVVSTVGTASPIDFNGMVRHYYLRKGPHLADLRVNLADKTRRQQQSHAIVLRLRKDLEAIASENHASIKLVETPPGPPVLSTLVAEIYGDKDASYRQLMTGADHVKTIMAKEPFVTDIDDSTEADRQKIDFVVDKEKAALHGVSTQQIIQALRIALSGDTPAMVHLPKERQPLSVNIILPRSKRSGEVKLGQIPVKSATGAMVPLAELVKPVHVAQEQPIYHKNLERVIFVTAEMAGRAPGEAVLDMMKQLKSKPMPAGTRAEWAGEGEWKITLRVFRDMGIAFAAALTGIYILLIVQTGSFFMPLLLMMAIPLTLIGAMPGFWLLNLITGETVGGFADPVFFTATGMIGMIALGGIVIRNSIVLIEFIQDAIKQGLPFKEAILQSGAIRMRPILLTAATTALGAWPITLDPIFSGLAWTLIFGLFASTVFTLLVIPVTYYALYRRTHDDASQA